MSTLPPKNVKPGSLNCVVFTMKRWQSNHYGYLVCTLSRQLQGHVLTFFWAKTDIAHCVPPLQTVNYGPKSKYIWSLSLFRAHQTGYCFVSLITYIGRRNSTQCNDYYQYWAWDELSGGRALHWWLSCCLCSVLSWSASWGGAAAVLE